MKKRKSRHHIIPRSRGGNDDIKNISWLRQKTHNYYHNLFSNKTPVEILRYLFRVFWNDNYDYLYEFLKEVEDEKVYHKHNNLHL